MRGTSTPRAIPVHIGASKAQIAIAMPTPADRSADPA